MASRAQSTTPAGTHIPHNLRNAPFSPDKYGRLQYSATHPGSPIAFYEVEDAINEHLNQGARIAGTDEERFTLLKNLISNPEWKGHSKIPLETWKAFVLSLPKDGSEDLQHFVEMPEDLWINLIWELGQNKAEFDLVDRLTIFDFIQKLFTNFSAEELLTLVRAHNTPADIDFWADVFDTFNIRKWRDIVIALSENELAELLFNAEDEFFSPLKKMNPVAFSQLNEAAQSIYESPSLIRTQCEISWRDQQHDIVSKLKLIARVVNPYVESFDDLENNFAEVLPIIESFPLLNTLRRLYHLKEELSFGLRLSDENKAKIDSVLNKMSPSFHLHLRVAFQDYPKISFMDEFETAKTHLRTWLNERFNETHLPDEAIEEYMDQDPNIAKFINFMRGVGEFEEDSGSDSDDESQDNSAVHTPASYGHARGLLSLDNTPAAELETPINTPTAVELGKRSRRDDSTRNGKRPKREDSASPAGGSSSGGKGGFDWVRI